MKKIVNIITVGLICLIAGGCIKKDNFAAPSGIINGTLTDAVTGKPFLSENNDNAASGNIRLYAFESSYTGTTTPVAQYFYIQPDGTYNNSKVFPGTYKIYPTDGAFVPVVYTNSSGTVVDNGSKTIQVKGGQTTTTNFIVTPFLKVDWVGDPVLNADGTVSVSCTFVRGTTDPTWQFNVSDVELFISNTTFVGATSYDSNLSYDLIYSGTTGNTALGTTVTLKSVKALGLHQGYYLRVGARTADNVNKHYNYSTVKLFDVP